MRGPNGQSILAAYSDTGEVLTQLGELTGEWENATVMSAQRFNALLEAFRSFRAQHETASRAGRG